MEFVFHEDYKQHSFGIFVCLIEFRLGPVLKQNAHPKSGVFSTLL